MDYQLRLQTVELTAMRARLHAQIAAPNLPPEAELVGTLRGPFCQHRTTLPATTRFRPLPGSATREALLTDPCLWSPGQPHLYQAQLELRRGGEHLATFERWLGLPALTTRGPHLFVNGKRWVVRGAHAAAVNTSQLDLWQKSELVQLAAAPSHALALECSRQGVLLVARLSAECWQGELARCADYAAVGIAVLPNTAHVHEAQAFGSHPLLAQEFGPGAEISPAPWLQVAIVHVPSEGWETQGPTHRAALARQLAALRQPVIVARQQLGQPASPESARMACDLLQRDLAPLGPLAGYIVG